ncbi:MAG: xanthine dehydrogenase family protein, partial [Alphaproteobacteria bacterium]|nr:xanthine dehydrogenase family protein [Alphaproteobacteria bacterium]
RLAHVAFVRSPYPHARIGGIETGAARTIAGVVRVFTGKDLASVCQPLTAAAANLPAVKAVAQPVLATETVKWQGEPVIAIVAESRAIAEDAAERVVIEWQELVPVADPEAALLASAALVHAEHGTNLVFTANMRSGDPDAGLGAAARTFERAFTFGRHTGVSLEPRGIIADYDPATRALTIHQSHQAPHQLQDVYAAQLGIPEHKVRVICPDVGGGFGIKLALYADELAVAAISVVLGRPVKYVADRLEAFVSDAHARDHRASARLAIAADGEIAALEVDDVAALGAYSSYPRLSLGEGMLMLAQCGAPYRVGGYKARLRCVYQNKVAIGTYRGVGQPIACAITEQLIDDAAAALGEDPVAYRRKRVLRDDAYPCTAPGGLVLERLSLHACLDRIVTVMDYARLRAEQAVLRRRGVHRGIGVIAFIEQTGAGPGLYGPTGIRLSTQDGCTVKLEPSGVVRAITSVTDQGQGTWTGIAQIVADALGVRFADVEVVGHDTAVAPYGGGAWASRGLSIGGEAAHAAAGALKAEVLALAARILQADPAALELRDGEIRDRANGAPRLALAELARIAHFRQDTLP